MQSNSHDLLSEGLDVSNVTQWEGRPKRQRKMPPKTYWEEYVETDTWYHKKLLEDIPDDEIWAATEDDNLDDAGEEGDDELDGEESDDSWSETIAAGTECTSEPSNDEDNLSSSASDGNSEYETECSSSDETEATVYRTPERK
jgi:hypothetical protein